MINALPPDESAVVVRLSEPTPALLFYLATIGAGIMPEKVVKSEGDNHFNEHPVGSGPFALQGR